MSVILVSESRTKSTQFFRRLVIQVQAVVSIGHEGFDPITMAIAEEEQVIEKRSIVQRLLYLFPQAMEAFAHVSDAVDQSNASVGRQTDQSPQLPYQIL